MTDRREVVRGLMKMRSLVKRTHWIQGSYVAAQYFEGDGDYADGAVVVDTKVVGCLVGLSRLVGAKQPTYIRGQTKPLNEMQPPSDLSTAMERALLDAIRDEFVSGYMPAEEEDEDGDMIEVDPSSVSIESWNDTDQRDREQVLELIGRTIDRVVADAE